MSTRESESGSYSRQNTFIGCEMNSSDIRVIADTIADRQKAAAAFSPGGYDLSDLAASQFPDAIVLAGSLTNLQPRFVNERAVRRKMLSSGEANSKKVSRSFRTEMQADLVISSVWLPDRAVPRDSEA